MQILRLVCLISSISFLLNYAYAQDAAKSIVFFNINNLGKIEQAEVVSFYYKLIQDKQAERYQIITVQQDDYLYSIINGYFYFSD